MNRREFILTGAASAAVVMMPLSVTPLASAPASPRIGYWGFSRGGEIWQGWDEAISSRADAIRAAEHYYGAGKVEIAWCVPRTLHYPDLREELCNWLCDEARRETLADSLLFDLEGANEESDFDGELADAFMHSKDHGFAAAVDLALCSALARLDRLDLYSLTGLDSALPWCSDVDPVLDLIQSDVVLRIDLDIAARAWGKANNLDDAPRVIDLEEHEEVVIKQQPKASDHQS